MIILPYVWQLPMFEGQLLSHLYLKVYLVSVNECCRCCNTFLEDYKYGGTRLVCCTAGDVKVGGNKASLVGITSYSS